MIEGPFIEGIIISVLMVIGLTVFCIGSRTFPQEESIVEYEVLQKQQSEIHNIELLELQQPENTNLSPITTAPSPEFASTNQMTA